MPDVGGCAVSKFHSHLKVGSLSDSHVDAECCLGTMTWGEQNTEAEAHEQLSYALDHGHVSHLLDLRCIP